MPVNYELITNEIEYQGLADLSVLVEDTSSNSPDYFRVSNLPTEFTAGKNTFHFKGNPLIFQEGSSVYIEVLDSNGEALYYETALDLESEEQTAIVTVYVNESTPSGTAYIILCSTISNDIDGNFLDTSQINLRWAAPVYIDISKRNDSEIIFDVLPEITITPSTGQYLTKSYVTGNKIVQLQLSSSNYYYRHDTPILTGYIVDAYSGNYGPLIYTIDTSSLLNANISFNVSSLKDAMPSPSSTVLTTQFTSSIDSFIYANNIAPGLSAAGGDSWDYTTRQLVWVSSLPVGTTVSDFLHIGQEIQFLLFTAFGQEIITAAILEINNNTITLDKTTSNQNPLVLGTIIPSIAIKLSNPISVNQTNGIQHTYTDASFNVSPTLTFAQPPVTSTPTENSNNLATVFFSNLQPQVGEVAKIKSYYRSAGIGEYILSNETDISDQAPEFGFNADVVTASFFLPTVHRNDRLDFKFEFINPVGLASKQVIESLNNLFLGGNTYIGGDDNLLTGSLYVAGATGTGVHISGKGSSAMIRSIGYTGFQNAIGVGGKGGFVMYSGSIQPILGSAESYSGVGLELVANSSSYFKYTTSGSGLLDVRTNSFFLGNAAGAFISGSGSNLRISASNFFLGNVGGAFISGSNGNLQISASNFFLGNVGGAFISGSNGNLQISASNFFLGNASQFISGSNGNLQISSSNFFLGNAAGAFISGSGSNLRISSSNFFLGNIGGAFISGSNNNLQISSSNFFLGNTGGTFISGSNNNLQISASNFFIGNNNTFISSSNNKLEILNYDGVRTNFRLDTAGNVTASAFIALTGSADANAQYMMNTAIGLTDGKNIGRILYHQTDPMEIMYPSVYYSPLTYTAMDSVYLQHWTQSYNSTNVASAINSGSATQPLSERWLNYESIISDLSYYSLPFENTVTVFGNIIVEKVSNYGGSTPANLVLALRFTVWKPVTSSYAYFGLSGNQDPAATDVGYVGGVSGSITYAPNAGAILGLGASATIPFNITTIGAKSVSAPFKAIITIPTGSQDTLNNVNLDYAFFKMNHTTTPPGTEFEFKAKFANFAVMSSRILTASASSAIGAPGNQAPPQFPLA
jgi:hypothetical protein